MNICFCAAAAFVIGLFVRLCFNSDIHLWIICPCIHMLCLLACMYACECVRTRVRAYMNEWWWKNKQKFCFYSSYLFPRRYSNNYTNFFYCRCCCWLLLWFFCYLLRSFFDIANHKSRIQKKILCLAQQNSTLKFRW